MGQTGGRWCKRPIFPVFVAKGPARPGLFRCNFMNMACGILPLFMALRQKAHESSTLT
jgi:hypothetical protein